VRSKSLLLLPCLALAGCATGPSLRSQMAAYIGADTQTVVQKLGVPDKHIKVKDSVQYLAYEIVTDYGFSGYYGPWGGYYYGGYPDVYTCEATFMLTSNRVSSVTLRGYCD
jgi:hypothetical protein